MWGREQPPCCRSPVTHVSAGHRRLSDKVTPVTVPTAPDVTCWEPGLAAILATTPHRTYVPIFCLHGATPAALGAVQGRQRVGVPAARLSAPGPVGPVRGRRRWRLALRLLEAVEVVPRRLVRADPLEQSPSAAVGAKGQITARSPARCEESPAQIAAGMHTGSRMSI